MKKVFLILGLIVLAMFVVACAPREGAIAGQAVAKGSTAIPPNVVKYGDHVTIRTVHGSFFYTRIKPNAFTIVALPKDGAYLVESYKSSYIIGGGTMGLPVSATSTITLRSYNNIPSGAGSEANGKYLTAETENSKPGKPWSISSTADVVGPWEKFKMTYKSGQKFAYAKGISYGEKFQLKTAHGKYVSAEPHILDNKGFLKEIDAVVVGNRDKAGEWETFTLEKVN